MKSVGLASSSANGNQRGFQTLGPGNAAAELTLLCQDKLTPGGRNSSPVGGGTGAGAGSLQCQVLCSKRVPANGYH